MKTAAESNPFETAARLQKRDRILVALREPFRVAVHACIAANVPPPTWADVATAIEQSIRLQAPGKKFSLVFGAVTTERASHRTWEMVCTTLREWAASDARGMERPS